MNQIISSTNQITMCDLVSADQMLDEVRDGTASGVLAQSIGMELIAQAAEMCGDFDLSDVESMSREDARSALDRIANGRRLLYSIRPIFTEYKVVSDAINHLIKITAYAESTVIPALILCPESAGRKAASVKTYIVKHPTTKLLKIGRSVDVEARIKNLQTGAGTVLETIAVLEGDIEGQLHKRFSDLRRHGEWFEDVDQRISKYVETVRLEA